MGVDDILKEERQDSILRKLSMAGKVVASKLAVELDVSEDTVRRDLLELDEKGLLKRVYGGALPVAPPVVNYLDRENSNVDMNQRMAMKALDFLRPDQLVAVDGSSANLVLVKSIPQDLKLTIITNSYQIAQVCSSKSVDIIILGGNLLRETMTIVGDAAAAQAAEYHPDLCFMGVYGIHPEVGLTIPYQSEVTVKRQLIQNSSKVISLVNPGKLNTVSKFHVCGIEAFTTLITDEDPASENLTAYRNRGLECI